MFCRDCGNKLSLRFLENEGLVPYCEHCGKYKFPFFPVAVSMAVVNRAESKVLLAKHAGEDEYKLFAGYVKKGESAEKTIPRELKEEIGLGAVKWKYLGSRFHEAKDLLMLGFLVVAEDGELSLGEEIAEARWCTPDEARELVVKRSSAAEFFLNAALGEIKHKG